MKILLIAMLVLLTTLAGVYASAVLKKRYELLEDMKYMLNETEHLLKYKNATVFEVLGFLKNNARLKQYDFISYSEMLCASGGYSFYDAWNTALAGEKAIFSDKGDYELILSFGDFFGKNELEGQLSAVGYLKEMLSGRCADARECCRSKGKLYRDLGVLTGALLSIMLM